MDADKSVTANFFRYYTLTVSIDGSGTTTPVPGEHLFVPGTIVYITASPAPGWKFSHWTGAAADPYSATTTVALNGNKSLVANFTRSVQNYKLTVNITGSGTTVPLTGEHFYTEGTVVSINAIPSEGWQFSNWTDGAVDPSARTTTVTMDSDKTITANFIESTDTMVFHTLTLEVDGQGVITPSEGVHSYAHGTSVVVTATPASGWRFEGWTGSLADQLTETTVVYIDRDMKVTARFIRATENPESSAGNNDPSGNLATILAVDGEGSANDKPQDIEGRPASMENVDVYPPEPAKSQGTPWYVFLAVAGVCVAAVALLVTITVNIRNSRR
jgi:hypothetical protein